ncbi:hypothetical protein [Sphingomonas panacisoli]|uniref:hypothetical protein n=1 Tax=Sphingomonas panacisoli TaxID=1813879 RepID=UPI001648D514|nr:hypothetical protein [Sphingomonas panacisoli]
MIGEVVVEAIGYVVMDVWLAISKAVYDRFGCLAAIVVGLTPIALLALVIWLVVVLVS